MAGMWLRSRSRGGLETHQGLGLGLSLVSDGVANASVSESRISVLVSVSDSYASCTGAPAGFQARMGKIRREAPKKFFRLPTLVFSLPTLPYVTVAYPAHRTEADLREKASLATNQEGPLPSPPLRLT